MVRVLEKGVGFGCYSQAICYLSVAGMFSVRLVRPHVDQ